MTKWIKIIPENFSELHIGDQVAPAFPGILTNETTGEPVEEKSNHIQEVYTIKGADAGKEQDIICLSGENNSALNVSRQELIDSWWLKKNGN